MQAGRITFADVFHGIGGFRLGLQQASDRFECVWSCENNKYAKGVYNHGFNETNHPEDIFTVQTGNIPDIELLCGGFPCFAAGTLIETDVGYKEIELLAIGDRVRTHLGRFKKITGIMQHDSEITRVYVRGAIPIETTVEHPFLTRTRTESRKFQQKTQYAFGDPKWTDAGKLTKNHYVGLPLNVKLRSEDTHSLEFWYIIGRWLGDGWITNHLRANKKIPPGHRGSRIKSRCWKAIICTGKNDGDSLETLIRAAGFRPTRTNERTGVKFHISSMELVKFLEPFGRGAGNKEVPGFVFRLPIKKQKSLFRGWADADGFEIDTYISVTTISKKLAIEMARIARTVFRTPVSIVCNHVPCTTIIEGRTVNQNPFFTVRVSKKPHCIWKWDTDVSWSQVRKIENTNLIKTVYNISVEEDESYVANDCIVHNCQSFSRMGNMQGLDDPRGILFFQLARILRDKRPSYYLFENVKNILYHDKGNTFRKIASVLWELGYTVEWQILDTRDFGIPQRRERVFITGSLRSKSRPKVYPVIGGPRVYCPPDWASKKCERWFWGKSYFSTFPRHYHKGVTCAGETYILMRTEDGLLRRLTPLEAERLQGFPDGWTSMMLIDGKTSQVSDTQRYSLIGNAVSVPVIKAIGERLYAQS